ncbi:MAG: CGNR zinc finger domain-containing protein [Hyphomicrobiales bacterium]|nr:CGNR zinc finger domain-containing protein [Hyphomicrobiales bacterium]
MTYHNGHPVRLIGGRLALDFLNTADWAADGAVVHEKIESFADLEVWLSAVGLPDARHPRSIKQLHQCRRDLRELFRTGTDLGATGLQAQLRAVNIVGAHSLDDLSRQPVLGLIAISALSVLSDGREHDRIKTCPGADCGWMFIDETKNGRRKWCQMEICGNRAKAARHYRRVSG